MPISQFGMDTCTPSPSFQCFSDGWYPSLLCLAFFLTQHLLLRKSPAIGRLLKEGGSFIDLILWQFPCSPEMLPAMSLSSLPQSAQFLELAPGSVNSTGQLTCHSFPAKTMVGSLTTAQTFSSPHMLELCLWPKCELLLHRQHTAIWKRHYLVCISKQSSTPWPHLHINIIIHQGFSHCAPLFADVTVVSGLGLVWCQLCMFLSAIGMDWGGRIVAIFWSTTIKYFVVRNSVTTRGSS